MTVAITTFAQFCRVEKGLSETTIQQYEQILSRLGGSGLVRMNEDDIRERLSGYAQIVGPRSQAKAVSVLRQFFKFLQIDSIRADDPMKRIDAPRFEKRIIPPPSEADIHHLLDSITQDSVLGIRDRAMFELAYAGGVRASELVSLRLSLLRPGSIVVHGKGDKERIVPFGRAAALAIAEYLLRARPLLARSKQIDTLFLDRSATPLTRQAARIALRRACQVAQLPPMRLHALRSASATHMLEHGADLRTIQTVLGHASIETTMFYTKCTAKHLRNALSHHPRFRRRAQIGFGFPRGER